MPKSTGLSPDAEAQEAADAEIGREIHRPAPKPKAPAPKKMASGGYVSKADGCISKGKTRGKFV